MSTFTFKMQVSCFTIKDLKPTSIPLKQGGKKKERREDPASQNLEATFPEARYCSPCFILPHSHVL